MSAWNSKSETSLMRVLQLRERRCAIMRHGWECFTSLCKFDPYRITELNIYYEGQILVLTIWRETTGKFTFLVDYLLSADIGNFARTKSLFLVIAVYQSLLQHIRISSAKIKNTHLPSDCWYKPESAACAISFSFRHVLMTFPFWSLSVILFFPLYEGRIVWTKIHCLQQWLRVRDKGSSFHFLNVYMWIVILISDKRYP